MTNDLSFESYSMLIKSGLNSVSKEELDNAVKIIYETTRHEGRIWLIGNGGSAATSSHFATDLSRCATKNGQPIKAISLCDNLGLITAIGNDFSFDDIFAMQLQNLGVAGDLLISISASGNSRNLIKAAEFANAHSIGTLSLVGFDGGALQEISANTIYVQTNIGDYGIAEDCHSIICHYISSQMRE
jgi:D-sedoheptulose 7-phosphate isomerase